MERSRRIISRNHARKKEAHFVAHKQNLGVEAILASVSSAA